MAIMLPENAYLAELSFEFGWECGRGYKRNGNSCMAVRVPQNAYLSSSDYGDDWECERRYRKADAGCISVIVPKNGYLTDSSQGEDGTVIVAFAPAGRMMSIIMHSSRHAA